MGLFSLIGKLTDAGEQLVDSTLGLTESIENIVGACNKGTECLNVAADGLLQDQIFSAEKAEKVRENKRLEWRKSLDLVADEPL